MIRSLRKRHQWMWMVLAVGLPILLIAAVGARREIPAEPFPEIVAAAEETGFRELQIIARAFEEQKISVRLLKHDDGRRMIELIPETSPPYPDALVYLGDGEWPGTAVLLGSLSGKEDRRFILPQSTGDKVHIYSLAHARHVADFQLPESFTTGVN